MQRSPLTELHAEIDEEAERLAKAHGARLQCKLGCSACCVDEITVFQVEADRIVAEYPEVLEEQPHPKGACAFLSAEGACRVYAARPYVCRTQGLPIAWVAGDTEFRDICELNEAGGPALPVLDDRVIWRIGPYEGRLAMLQEKTYGDLGRVALRSLLK